jgi:hypothetical protein
MKKRLYSLFAVILVLVLIFSGCTKAVGRFEEEELRQYTETILNAVLADDLQAAYQPFQNICLLEDFSAKVFGPMQEMLGLGGTYRLKLLSLETNVYQEGDEKISSRDAVYKLTIGEKHFIVSVGSDSTAGLRGFTVSPFESTDYYKIGTLLTLKGASWDQILWLLSNIITLGVWALALVDCIRKKHPGRFIWFFVIFLGFIGLGYTAGANDFRYNFNFAGLADYSALIAYGSGTTTLRFLMPAGAFLYWIVRLARFKNAPLDEAEEQVSPAQPAEKA